MLFLYAFLLAIAGMTTLLIVEYIKTKKPVLQIVRKWCIIDNVVFESDLKKIHISIIDIYQSIQMFFIQNIKNISAYRENQGLKFRSLVRKKFQTTEHKQKLSTFIHQMKDK